MSVLKSQPFFGRNQKNHIPTATSNQPNARANHLVQLLIARLGILSTTAQRGHGEASLHRQATNLPTHKAVAAQDQQATPVAGGRSFLLPKTVTAGWVFVGKVSGNVEKDDVGGVEFWTPSKTKLDT